jgi:hypothetical protein
MRTRSVGSIAIGGLFTASLLVCAAGPSSAQQVIVPTNATDWTFHSIVVKPNTDKGAQAYLAKWHLAGQSAISSNLIYSFPAQDLIENFQDSHLQNAENGPKFGVQQQPATP